MSWNVDKLPVKEEMKELTVLVPYKVSKPGQGKAVREPFCSRVVEHTRTEVYAQDGVDAGRMFHGAAT